ncbi:6,7-dimethyl-8-ribityllumazine synthase [Leucobacter coleopterorum]|uniref:6,7-dimethyl-8-ribityllumazine synthase n=1 Tax=Leucobacter coleopterorum TaxID=2714933 RepID=A0ABX6JYP2_9MICO|nr:6,7-dimethyl-8-ribityllumazine synthase [Leucobacter coleopterorum]QIM19431.1 6,7-dimethyl-8-ribityllumazine synthase [Leucobacter coleopterorum]
MSGAGAPDLSVNASGLRIAVIAGSWHEEIMSPLIKGAHETAIASGADHTLFRVAGAFELPAAAQAALQSGFDAVVCLGVIIRGGTPHFDYICNSVTDGLTRVQLDSGKPVGFGVLTTDTEQQALDRSGQPGAPESKGKEAAEAALHLAVQLRRIREDGPTMELVPGRR